MQKFRVIELRTVKQLLKAKWIVLSFLLFAWVSGGLIFYSASLSQKQEQLAQTLKVTNSLVISQLQLLQIELGNLLSEELTASSSDETLEPLRSDTEKFSAVGLVKLSGQNLKIEKLFKDSSRSDLDMAFVQTQLSLLASASALKQGQAMLWIDQGPDRVEYLFSLLPFEIENNKMAWGIGLSRIPTSWLRFVGAESLFLLDKESGKVLSAYAGENQGKGMEAEWTEGSSYQVASYEISSKEARAWKEIRGTNLVLMVRESSSSPILMIGGWGLLSLGFLLGLILMTAKDRDSEYSHLEDQIEPYTEQSLEAQLQTESAIDMESPKSEILEEIDSAIDFKGAAPLKRPPVESLVEDQLLETVLGKEERGNRLVDGVSETITSLGSEIQACGVRVNVLIPESITSGWPQTQLKTVLEEVVRNSLESMEDSEIKTLTFSAEQRDSFVELIVEDTGMGMTDEVLERSLEAFFSTKPTLNKRRGLGLNVAKRLLEISGGKLRIESTPSIGTKVILSIAKENLVSSVQDQL